MEKSTLLENLNLVCRGLKWVTVDIASLAYLDLLNQNLVWKIITVGTPTPPRVSVLGVIHKRMSANETIVTRVTSSKHMIGHPTATNLVGMVIAQTISMPFHLQKHVKLN